jgi:catechol 2,3-dioxygenase-like lactoylglutathione lyase family enzyme
MYRKYWTVMILVGLALLSVHCDCKDEEVAAVPEVDPYEGATFKRITLVVADLERSFTLYRDVLGFQVDRIMESSEESYSYPVFRIDPEATIRFATLSAGTKQIRILGLTEVKGMDLPRPGKPLMTATVLRTADIDRDFEKVEALGLEVVEPKFVELTEDYHFYERAFVDFDGHLVVLHEVVKEPAGS